MLPSSIRHVCDPGEPRPRQQCRDPLRHELDTFNIRGQLVPVTLFSSFCESFAAFLLHPCEWLAVAYFFALIWGSLDGRILTFRITYGKSITAITLVTHGPLSHPLRDRRYHCDRRYRCYDLNHHHHRYHLYHLHHPHQKKKRV